MSRIMLSILIAALWMPALCFAQTPSQPPAAQALTAIGPAKIAWINMEQAVFMCEEGKKVFEEIQKFVTAKKNELDNLRKEADTLRGQLEMQASKLTDDARADLQEQVQQKETAFERFREDGQKEIESRQVRASNQIGRKMVPVIEKVAKEKGLSAVLNFSSNRDAYVDPSLNITEDIIIAYNQAYPVGAPKAQAAPAPAKKQ